MDPRAEKAHRHQELHYQEFKQQINATGDVAKTIINLWEEEIPRPLKPQTLFILAAIFSAANRLVITNRYETKGHDTHDR